MERKKINRIPLKKRIDNIRNGYAGDEAYNIEAIVRFANIPITEYMAAFQEEYGNLLYSLDISREEAAGMTYQDVAKRVNALYWSEETIAKAVKAMQYLAKPFNYCYEKRNQYY